MEQLPKRPIKRSALRLKVGAMAYCAARRIMWLKIGNKFARQKTEIPLPYLRFSHKTPLLRSLKDVDMRLQYNKIVNLKIAVSKINGIVIHSGEIFSYWRLIGRPTKRKGYLEGMVLKSGHVSSGIGGGLCQLSNLIFFMALHTPLTVIERHRHSYDVFPDSNRTQPFGSGATCFYPHIDLMIRNDTPYDYQIALNVGEEYLEGKFLCSSQSSFTYKIEERNHEIKHEFWGGYSRNNEIYRQKYDENGVLVEESLAVKNSAIMMYNPYIESKHKK